VHRLRKAPGKWPHARTYTVLIHERGREDADAGVGIGRAACGVSDVVDVRYAAIARGPGGPRLGAGRAVRGNDPVAASDDMSPIGRATHPRAMTQRSRRDNRFQTQPGGRSAPLWT